MDGSPASGYQPEVTLLDLRPVAPVVPALPPVEELGPPNARIRLRGIANHWGVVEQLEAYGCVVRRTGTTRSPSDVELLTWGPDAAARAVLLNWDDRDGTAEVDLL